MTEKQDAIYKMMVFFFGYLTAGHSSLRAPQSRKTKTWARWFPSSLFPGCGAGLRAQAEPSRLGDLRRWSWETSERVRGMKRKHLPLNWEGTKQARELTWTSPAWQVNEFMKSLLTEWWTAFIKELGGRWWAGTQPLYAGKQGSVDFLLAWFSL